MSPFERLRAHERTLRFCTFCPKLCRFACPVAEAEKRESLTPTAKMTLMELVSRDLVEMDRDTVEPWFCCTGCGLHTTACNHGIDIAPVLREGRAIAAEKGLVPEPLKARAEAAGKEAPELQALTRELLPDAPEEGEAALVPGRFALLNAPDLVRHAWALLRCILPTPPARWSGPQSLGLELLHAGMMDSLEARAREVAQASLAHHRLWIMDPEEVWMLRKIYPDLGIELPLELLLPFEALDCHMPAAWRGRLRPEKEGPQARPPARPEGAAPATCYHDPCYLGRHLGIYDAPRRIIEELTREPPAEPPWSRETGWCCGGGGGYLELDSKAAARVARARAEQLLATGARRVVTACPRCRAQLRDALHDDIGHGIEVLDLLELVNPEWV